MEAIYRPIRETARSVLMKLGKLNYTYIYLYIHFSKLTKFDSTCESK